MKAFARLLDRLVLTPSRNGKLTLLVDYFRQTPDPDRGYALAALTDGLDIKGVKPALLKELVLERMDPILFQYSYDYVGDLAETISLVWEPQTLEAEGDEDLESLSKIVERLQRLGRNETRSVMRDLFDRLDTSERFALIKLVTGGLRIGVSARLTKQALALYGDKDVADIESLWHGLKPPYTELFAWLEDRIEKPVLSTPAIFHSVMLSTPIEDRDLSNLDPKDFAAEWKWDGIRVQATAGPGGARLWSRGGEDISASFPDILAAMNFHAVVDGELLVLRDGVVAPFSDLQQRLNRKAPGAKMLAQYPAHLRLYDLLFDGAEDLRALPFSARRARLEAWPLPPRMDLSPLIPFESFEQLAGLREGARAASMEGLMIKRLDAPYVAGRTKGHWWKWKRGTQSVDAVLMYAQRGHGKRSSFYSDYTFGLWRGEELVPIGKAYSGYTDAELAFMDKWIRDHTTQRFGPVREVERGLVLEVEFDAAQLSNRHKSGVALRFPRIARIRRDKPAAEADRLETLLAMIPAR